MLILTSSPAIRHTVATLSDHVPVRLLNHYAVLLDTEPIAWLFILQPGDSADLLLQLRDQPFEGWEYIDRHDGWYEAVFIRSDAGEGDVVLVPDQPDTDPNILSLCRANAVQAQS